MCLSCSVLRSRLSELCRCGPRLYWTKHVMKQAIILFGIYKSSSLMFWIAEGIVLFTDIESWNFYSSWHRCHIYFDVRVHTFHISLDYLFFCRKIFTLLLSFFPFLIWLILLPQLYIRFLLFIRIYLFHILKHFFFYRLERKESSMFPVV